MENNSELLNEDGERYQALRDKAEKMRQKLSRLPDSSTFTSEEVQKLVYELQLYQIELEVQNEELRMATENLEQAVFKYEDLYDFAPVGYITLNEFGIIQEANLTATKQLGMIRRDLLGRRLAFFIRQEQVDDFHKLTQLVLNSDRKQTAEFTFSRYDRSVFRARLECIAIRGNREGMKQWRTAIIDISEYHEAQEKLEQSQNFVQKIANTMPDILTVYDLEQHRNIYGNREIYSLLGISPEQVRLMGTQELQTMVHPDDLVNFRKNMDATRSLADGEISEFEYRIRNIFGTYSTLLVRSVAFSRGLNGQVSQILSIQQDITFKKEAEEELRFKTQIINELQNNLPIVVSTINPDGKFLTMTGSGLDSLAKEGIPNLEGQNIFELFPDLRNQLEKVFGHGEKASYVYCVGEGQKTCFQNYVFLDETKHIAISFSIDISERLDAERRIIAEREFSQQLLDNSVDGILAFDNKIRITSWNKVMEQNTKLPREEVIGKSIFDIFPEFINTEVDKAIKKVLRGKQVALFDQDFGLKNVYFEAFLNPLFDETRKVKGGLAILRNITQRKKLEQESTQLKLEKQKEVLNAVLNTQEEERKRIAESLHNGVGQLLYAAKLNLEHNKSGKNGSLNLLIELLDEAIRETRTISFELMPRILEDFGLETALEELLKRISSADLEIKLQTKGLQRFSETIEVAVYRIIQELINNIIKHAKATEARLEVSCSRNVLQILVTDNGVGFDAKSKSTRTKGIGLMGIQNRVKLLDGKMEIDSEPGKGTTVCIKLKIS